MADTEKTFHEQTNAVLDSMKVSFQLLEKYSGMAREMADARLLFEEENDVGCDCVSATFVELREMSDAVRHVMETYGRRIVGAVQHVTDHDRGKEVVEEVKAGLENLLNNVQAGELSLQSPETGDKDLN